MTQLKKIIALSIATSSIVMAGGYKLPEQSLNSIALSDAYVAHTMGADTAYYNPAAMAFMDDKQYIEGALTLAHLPSQEYSLGPLSGESETENLLIPTIFYVSKPMDNIRWGVSLVVPGGLTKRWKTPYQKLFAEEFTLKNIELNPVVSYKVNDAFSIGAGARIVYSEGVVKSDGNDAGFPVKRDMEGNTIEFGYNVALLYKPTTDVNFAMTYRSNIDLTEDGQANLYFGGVGQQYNADVTVPLPATFDIAISKTWQEKVTLEFKYQRIFWSSYKALDFNYDRPIQANLVDSFDKPLIRDWKDTNSFRLGATIKMDNKLTAMFGIGIDKSPVPLTTIGFELADSDSRVFSMGFRYQQNENLSWGASFLVSDKDSLSLVPGVAENQVLANGGGFSEGGAFLTTVGVAYEF
ncbi:MAG TPA: long-chain fatty acid transporter [Epsilonproteobacteria bacterium]|nr:long-chain fatty acid transporter [Campylobacterota bacterium]